MRYLAEFWYVLPSTIFAIAELVKAIKAKRK